MSSASTARQAASKSALRQLVERHGALAPVDRDHVLHGPALLVDLEDAVEEGLLRHEDRGLGVAHQVCDLLGRVGVVDRERSGAQVHRRRVHEVELGAVREHDRHGVALAESKRGEAGGVLSHPVGVVAPGDGELVPLGPQRDAVRVVLRGDLEGLAEC
jgi:hypothetical protein